MNADKRKRIKILKISLCGVFMIAVIAGVIFFEQVKSTKEDLEGPPGEMQVPGENIITASGLTSMGMREEIYELDFLETKLFVEESYLSVGDIVESQTAVFKISEETLEAAMEELEEKVTDTSLAYRQGVIDDAESRLYEKSVYEKALISKEYAQAEYESALEEAAKKKEELSSQVEEAQKLYEEYKEAADNNYYYTYYNIKELEDTYYDNFSFLMELYEKWDIEGLYDRYPNGASGSAQGAGGTMGGMEFKGTGGNGQSGSDESDKLTVYEMMEELVTENGEQYKTAVESYEKNTSMALASLEQARSNLASLQAELTEAQLAYEKQVITVRTEYETTQTESENASYAYETALQKLDEQLEKLRSAKEEAEENLEVFRTTVGDGYFYTKDKGTVVMNRIREESYLSEEEILFAYSSPETVTVEASVAQSDIAGVEIGDTAYVAVNGYGEYEGQVTAINPVSSSGGRSSVNYTVTVELKGEGDELESNLTAYIYLGLDKEQLEQIQSRICRREANGLNNTWKERLKNKRLLKKGIPALLLLAVLTGASIYTVFIRPKLDGEKYIYIEETVQRGDLILGIMESGNIEWEESSVDYTLDLSALEEEDEDEDEEEEETIKYLEIEEVYAVNGQRIKKGDALFKLTKKSREAVRKKLETLCKEAQIALAEAKADLKLQLLQAKSVYDTSLLEASEASSSYLASVTKTEESLNSLQAGIKVWEEEIVWYKKQLAEEELWESLEEAKEAFTKAKNIYEETDIHNATAYASNYTDYKNAGEQLEAIEEKIETLQESIAENEKKMEQNRIKIAEAQAVVSVEKSTAASAYESAVLEGELAEDIYQYTVSALEETVTAAKADKEEADANLQEMENFAGEDGIVYADGTGLVTNVAYSAGDDLVYSGAVISYVKEDAYTVTIDVSEEDIPEISVGEKVEVAFTAYPEEIYEGCVTAVTSAAADGYAATISYPVTIKIEGDTSALYGGMTAEVTFVTDSVTDVLYISKKAVQEIDGKPYVYVKDSGGNRKLKEVETGFSDGADIEIVSGLNEGDIVYIESRISGSETLLMERSSQNSESMPSVPEKNDRGEGGGRQ